MRILRKSIKAAFLFMMALFYLTHTALSGEVESLLTLTARHIAQTLVPSVTAFSARISDETLIQVQEKILELHSLNSDCLSAIVVELSKIVSQNELASLFRIQDPHLDSVLKEYWAKNTYTPEHFSFLDRQERLRFIASAPFKSVNLIKNKDLLEDKDLNLILGGEFLESLILIGGADENLPVENIDGIARFYPRNPVTFNAAKLDGVVSLFKSISVHKTSLQSLQLIDISLTHLEVEEISHMLTKNSELKDLKLFGCGLTDDHTTLLAEGLRLNSSLKSLNLIANSITQNGHEILSAGIQADHNLSLELDEDPFAL
jgi:hypothetical protein